MADVIDQQDGDHVTLLKCGDCGAYYETDETVTNDCPDCGSYDWTILTGVATDGPEDWRADPEAFDTDDEGGD